MNQIPINSNLMDTTKSDLKFLDTDNLESDDSDIESVLSYDLLNPDIQKYQQQSYEVNLKLYQLHVEFDKELSSLTAAEFLSNPDEQVDQTKTKAVKDLITYFENQINARDTERRSMIRWMKLQMEKIMLIRRRAELMDEFGVRYAEYLANEELEAIAKRQEPLEAERNYFKDKVNKLILEIQAVQMQLNQERHEKHQLELQNKLLGRGIAQLKKYYSEKEDQESRRNSESSLTEDDTEKIQRLQQEVIRGKRLCNTIYMELEEAYSEIKRLREVCQIKTSKEHQ